MTNGRSYRRGRGREYAIIYKFMKRLDYLDSFRHYGSKGLFDLVVLTREATFWIQAGSNYIPKAKMQELRKYLDGKKPIPAHVKPQYWLYKKQKGKRGRWEVIDLS